MPPFTEAGRLSRVLEEDGGYWHMRGPAGDIYIPSWPEPGKGWAFDGDAEQPSFTPSVKNTWDDPNGIPQCDHIIVTKGRVEYCTDCTHEWAGTTHDLLPLP